MIRFKTTTWPAFRAASSSASGFQNDIISPFLTYTGRSLQPTPYGVRSADQTREDDLTKAERTNEILRDKDDKLESANKEWRDKLEKANEKSNQVAIDAVKVGTIMSERQNQLIGLMEDVLELLRKRNGHAQSNRDERRADGDNPGS